VREAGHFQKVVGKLRLYTTQKHEVRTPCQGRKRDVLRNITSFIVDDGFDKAGEFWILS
jgi:hypothetical protein